MAIITKNEAEVWKSVKDFPGYEVSNLGRMKSYKVAPWKDPRILPGNVNVNGYRRVTLVKQKKEFYLYIHHLVLNTFIGLHPKGYECNHKNGIKTDNRLSNLEWTTHGRNMAHAFQIGLIDTKGSKAPNAKLRNGEVIEIRRLAELGIKQTVIAKIFKISCGNVDMIIRRWTWNHI